MNSISVKCLLIAYIGFSLSAIGAAQEPSSASPTGEIVSKGPLNLRGPAKIILGRNASVEISLKPLKTDKPILVVNTGKISRPRLSGRRLRATYTLPENLFPQVAIIAALSQTGQLLDWIAIPLDGETEIDTKTEQLANVLVRIDESDFGPVRANQKGSATIGVVVPPGVDRGTTIVTDRLGNQKTTTFNLNVSPFNRMLGVCPSTGDRLVLLVTDAHGKPEEKGRFKLKSTAGAFRSIKMLAPGFYEALLVPPGNVVANTEVTLSAKLRGDKASQTACSVTLNPHFPTAVKMNVSPRAFVAGSSTVVSLELDFLDADGKRVSPVPVEISTDIGEISDVLPTNARWRLPDAFAGKSRGVATVRTRTSRVLSAKAAVELQAGPLSRLELSTRNALVRADGYSETTIFARGYDKFGNPVSSARLTAEAEGELSRFRKNSNDDTHEATYTAPRFDYGRDDVVIVRDASGAAKASIRIKLLPSTTPITICPKIGFITNLGAISSAVFGVDVAVRPPILRERLSVGIEVFGYGNASEERITGRSDQSRLSVWVVPLLARATYQIPIDPVTIYAGIAGGISIAGMEIASESDGLEETRGVYFSLLGLSGADVNLGPGRAAIELAYLYSPSEVSNLKGNLGGLVVTGGYRFEF